MRRRALALCAVGVLLQACAALPKPAELVSETAFPPAASGTLHDYDARIAARLKAGESAHWLLDRNQLALEARLALTDEATDTLDIQYFIWQSDATGHLLAARVLDAANRGVKVRLLLDDFSILEVRDDIVKLDAHPLIEVRVYNPWAARNSRITKGFEFLSRPVELNRRMHNKTYVADGRFAIVGGRNIGDRYFGLYGPFVQNDLDVLLAGPVVAEVQSSFDLFWNDSITYSIATFTRGKADPIDVVERRVDGVVAANAHLLSSFPAERADWSALLEPLVGNFAAGRAELIYDSPRTDDPEPLNLHSQFNALIGSAQREVLISSPYFIPDAGFRDLARQLVARGVRVVVVTNSLATNNHVVAHTGYKRWRREMLTVGVELYELRGDAAALQLYVTPPATVGALGLHTKAVVIDGRVSFIGSPNVDPRSMVKNTEIGVATESDELARRLRGLIVRDTAPENAWRVTIGSDGWLTWTSGEKLLKREPAKGFRQRALEFLLNLLPLKKQV